jgi:DNA-binding transcriptional LysR family regulator
MEVPSVGMIKSFVAAGLGVSLISSRYAADEVKVGTVKLIELEHEDLWRELGVVYQSNRTLPRSAKTFVDLILNEAMLSKGR